MEDAMKILAEPSQIQKLLFTKMFYKIKILLKLFKDLFLLYIRS